MAAKISLPPDKVDQLVKACMKAKDAAYAPYSNFPVGAALMSTDGRIFTGCNVENAAYPLGICAERCAMAKAVSEGCRKFLAIAVSTNVDDFVSPCGSCRQVLAEFGDFHVILTKPDLSHKILTVVELLPHSFSSKELNSVPERQ